MQLMCEKGRYLMPPGVW